MAFEFLPEERQAFLDINFVERYEKFALARQFPEEKKTLRLSTNRPRSKS
ncbi:hypothetical protein JO388_06635 [Streptococcus suis]|nr:hypothetical protein [Streptococcus suis]MBM7153007.1 hypothetical protein [Streptococcus suis]MBM7179958.1 hypothetical protein [Streptococcus suis]MDG4502802.1 hypothetical protein [Streptococcus suis]